MNTRIYHLVNLNEYLYNHHTDTRDQSIESSMTMNLSLYTVCSVDGISDIIQLNLPCTTANNTHRASLLILVLLMADGRATACDIIRAGNRLEFQYRLSHICV